MSTRVRLLSACGALVVAVGTGCPGSFCPSFECVGGAWITVVAADEGLLPAGAFGMAITADASTLEVQCVVEMDGAPRGVCLDGFEAMTGPDAYWVSFEPAAATDGAPTIFARVFRRASAPGGVHTYGPTRVSVTLFDADGAPIAAMDEEPRYEVKGIERCGECDEPEAPIVLELVGA